jgi:hypothetical protein
VAIWDYAQVEDVLARMHRVHPDVQRKAFRARLQHLQKLGVPLNLRPGKGRKISYSEDEVLQWALCLELAQYNVIPLTAVNTVKAYWKSHLADTFREALQAPKNSDDLMALFSPHILPRESAPVGLGEPKILRGEDALRRAPPGRLHMTRLSARARETFYFSQKAVRSAMVINLSQIIRDLRRLRFLHERKAGEPLWPVFEGGGTNDVGPQAHLDDPKR